MRLTTLKGVVSIHPEFSSAWAICHRADPEVRLRLYCFPFAGGGASFYRDWAADMPPGVELWAIQPPGRENRLLTPAYSDLLALADAVASILLPQLALPFAFFGHSMGALLSFELTRLLRRYRGLQPVHLFLSGHRAPWLPLCRAPIHQLPDAQFMESLATLRGTPAEVLAHSELMELLLPALRADFAACESYKYEPEASLTCPATVLGGSLDPEVPVGDLKAWEDGIAGHFRSVVMPGNHFYLRPMRARVLDEIRQDLCAALRVAPASAHGG